MTYLKMMKKNSTNPDIRSNYSIIQSSLDNAISLAKKKELRKKLKDSLRESEANSQEQIELLRPWAEESVESLKLSVQDISHDALNQLCGQSIKEMSDKFASLRKRRKKQNNALF